MVDRSADFDTLVSLLVEAVDSTSPTKTVAIVGPGGFGKTTLATQVCRETRVADRFDEVLWVETGEHCNPARVVQQISDLCVHLSGVRPPLADAEQAGFHLARVLGDRRVLIVVDNVWSAADLSPFLLGGPNTVRLVTTRNARVCPSQTAQLRLGPMSEVEIRELLHKSVPSLGREETVRLAELCSGWPLLASVVSSTVGQDLEWGAQPAQAVSEAGRALDSYGPGAFDVWDSDQRRNAIGHAVDASLRSLEERVEIAGASGLSDRYLSLAIFPAAKPIPLSVLSTWWGQAYGWTPLAVRQFCRALADRSLIDMYLVDQDAVLLHDVFRGYLRHRIGEGQRELHRSLLDAHREIAGGSWIDLGLEHGYLWTHLTHHLHEADLADELGEVLAQPRYIVKKVAEFGYETLAADLAAIGRAERPTTTTWQVAEALTRSGYLLHRLTSWADIAATLLTSLIRTGLPAETVESLRSLVGSEGFDVQWSTTEDTGHPGHIGAVTSVTTHRNTLASGGEDGIVRIWDLGAGQLVQQLHGHTGWVYSVAFSPDGKTLASAGDDMAVRLWQAETGKPLAVLFGHTQRIRSLTFTSDGRLVSGAEDGRVCLWDTVTASMIRMMETPGCPLWSVAVSADDALIAAVGEDEFVRLYDLESGDLLEEKAAHRDWIRAVGFSGTLLVTGSGDRTVRVWEVSDRRLTAIRAIGVPAKVRAVAILPHQGTIVVADEEAAIRVFNDTGQLAEQLAPESVDWIRDIDLMADGRVVAACEDGGIRVWNGEEFSLLSQGSNTTWSTAFTEGTALLGKADGTIEFRAATTAEHLGTLSSGEGRAWALSAAPGAAAAACGDGPVRLWSPYDRWQPSLLLNEEERRTWSVAINQAGTRVAASSPGGVVRVWDLPEGNLIWERQAHEGRIRSMEFDRSGGLLLTGGGEGNARLWRPADGRQVGEFSHPGSWVRTVSIDSDGTRVALGCGSGDIYVHDLASGQTAVKLNGHSGRVLMLGFTHDSDGLVSAAADGTVRYWSLDASKQISEVRADATLQCAAVDAVNGVVLVGSAAGTVALRIPGHRQ
ncbi:NB-ARC domain-containing protein [Actinocorallia libanotica]|uniref:AAA+ ATPase domain-containing protein n=1 Tax=Actinocorallia libanotica TaxID=46162 RepID=A0ABN1S1D4_9ACTN